VRLGFVAELSFQKNGPRGIRGAPNCGRSLTAISSTGRLSSGAAVRAGDLDAQPPAAESKRPATGTASGDNYNDDVMLTFERAPKWHSDRIGELAFACVTGHDKLQSRKRDHCVK
jgi:hypothetical protein